jgi:tetratricopeptide (TPR) repeat protein
MSLAPSIEALRQAVQAGQDRLALRDAVALLARHPDDGDLLEIAAIAAERCGDGAGAERYLRHLVAIAPDLGWARDDLAQLLLRMGRAEDAEAVARAALDHDPADPAAHAFVGQRLIARAALCEGVWHLRAALRHAPGAKGAAVLPVLGDALLRMGRIDEARVVAATALAQRPPSFEAAALATEIAIQAGDAAAARIAFEQARARAAPTGRDVMLLGARALATGADWPAALALLDRLPADAGGGALLLRGRLRERAGRHDEAWRDFTTGKARLARPYPRATVEAHCAALADWPTDLPPAPARTDGPQPLFILGMPRSGTTLLEQILSAHSGIRAGGELPFVAELRDFAQTMLGAGNRPFPTGIASLRHADRHHLALLFRDFYLARAEVHGLRAAGARFFTDKMPLNELYAPLIRLAFPDAPMLLTRRHPLDILVSIMAHDMTHGFHCGYRLDDAAHLLAAVAALTDRYQTRLDWKPLIVRYETMVTDGPTEIARIMAAIGLPVDPAQRDFHRQARHAPTPSHAQVREPLHRRSIGRWRHHAAPLAAILPLVTAAMAQGGYTA